MTTDTTNVPSSEFLVFVDHDGNVMTRDTALDPPYEDALRGRALRLVEQVLALQELNGARFRVHGGLYEDGPYAALSTRFRGPVTLDGQPFWEWAERVAVKCGATVRLVSVHPGDGWDRVVDFQWDVRGKTVDQVESMIAKHSVATQKLWDAAGVEVL